MSKNIGIELCIAAAAAHGENSEPDHEVGDLQDFLRKMWGVMTPGQRMKFMADKDVTEMIESEIPDVDVIDAFDKFVGEQRQILADQSANGRFDAYSQIVTTFPGFLLDYDVDGGDLVDWVGENLNSFSF